MRRTLFLYVLLCFVNSTWAQVKSTVLYPDANCASCSGNVINSVVLDTLEQVLYIAGKFDRIGTVPRSNVAAIDLRTGSLLPFSVNVGGGAVSDIIKAGNSIVIAGNFTSVNGVPRQRLAAINVQTSQLNISWNPNPNGAVRSLAADSNYLYVAGDFTSISSSSRNFMALYDASTLSLDGWSPVLSPSAGNYFCDELHVENDTIYFLTSDTLNISLSALYRTTYNSGTIVQLAGGVFNEIHDYYIHDSKAYLVGYFSDINGSVRQNTASVDLITKLTTPWNPSYPTFPTKLRIEGKEDTVFILSRDDSRFDTTNNHIKRYSTGQYASSLGTFKYYHPLLFGALGEIAVDFDIVSDKLIEYWKYKIHGATLDSIDVYCFQPSMPQSFLDSSEAVCPGEDSVLYSVRKSLKFVDYFWEYSGQGVSLLSSKDTTYLNIGHNATSGFLRVRGINQCGLLSEPIEMYVNVKPLPDVINKPDERLTCSRQQLHLTGQSNDTLVNYSWYSSSGVLLSSGTSLIVSVPGEYSFKVTSLQTSCFSFDTVNVLMDTAKPTLPSFPDLDTITCFVPSVLLDVQVVDLVDTVTWIDAYGTYPNPLTVTDSGVYFYQVLDTTNGCFSVDSIYITADKNKPDILLPKQDSVITCNKPSLVISGGSSSPIVEVRWFTSSGDTSYSPCLITVPGWQTLWVYDPFNGCVSTRNLYIASDTAKPKVFAVQDSLSITCSNNFVTLQASIPDPSTVSEWSGPTGSQPNPGFAFQIGQYVLTVIDTANGCSTKDTTEVVYEKTLDVISTQDTLVCKGDSVELHTLGVGATAPVVYTWNGISSLQAHYSSIVNDTSIVVVEVNDINNCYGKDTIMLYTASPIIDSFLVFSPCLSGGYGQVQLITAGGIPPYRHCLNDTLCVNVPWFDTVYAGEYTLSTYDSIGCSATSILRVDSSGFQPEVNFLVSTNSFKGDTIVLVNISNPRPDTTEWAFSANVTLLGYANSSPIIIYDDTGKFDVTMNAKYGGCEKSILKEINWLQLDSLYASRNNENGIKGVFISPNPNNGVFSVEVLTYKKQNISIKIYDLEANLWYQHTEYKQDHIFSGLDLSSAKSGSYLLVVTTEFDSAVRNFVIAR